MNDSKPKNDHNNKIIRVNNSDGVRFNEDVQINTINSNDNNNISIFSPEVFFKSLTLLFTIIDIFRLLIQII
jgi:hypothetical protein